MVRVWRVAPLAEGDSWRTPVTEPDAIAVRGTDPVQVVVVGRGVSFFQICGTDNACSAGWTVRCIAGFS